VFVATTITNNVESRKWLLSDDFYIRLKNIICFRHLGFISDQSHYCPIIYIIVGQKCFISDILICFWSKWLLFVWQKWFPSDISICFWQKWFPSDISICFCSKWLFVRQKWFPSDSSFYNFQKSTMSKNRGSQIHRCPWWNKKFSAKQIVWLKTVGLLVTV
jgi:hypothetical protein